VASFFTYFTSAFGTCVLVALFVAWLTGDRINLGAFGLIGIPILCLLYAFARKLSGGRNPRMEMEMERKTEEIRRHPAYGQFLAEDPERKFIYTEDLPSRFAAWLESRSTEPKYE
jgi:hypothetical protein